MKANQKETLSNINTGSQTKNIGSLVNKPVTSSKAKILNKGASYLSKFLSGLGWEYAGFGFQPQDGTGIYLMWTSLSDFSRVGDLLQANDNSQMGSLNLL